MIKVTKFGEDWLNGSWAIEENLAMGQYTRRVQIVLKALPEFFKVWGGRVILKNVAEVRLVSNEATDGIAID